MTIQTEARPVTPKVKTAADVLRHAALIIEERGWWTPARTGNPPAAICVGLAIDLASGSTTANPEPGETASWALMHRLGLPSGSGTLGLLFDWNDSPGRTAADVVAALRAAADEAER